MTDQDSESTEVSAQASMVNYPRRKRIIIYLLLVYAAFVGCVSNALPEDDQAIDFLFGLPYLILGISWCFADAAERKYRLGRVSKIVMILLFAVGFPVYIFRTRGIGGVKTIGMMFLLIGGMCACAIVAAVATQFVYDAMNSTRFNP